MPVMKTGDTIDIVMHHEVKEMGKHMYANLLQRASKPLIGLSHKTNKLHY